MIPSNAYRAGVGIVLINDQGLVFGGRRFDVPENAWQMPQGGMDPGETPQATAFRELAEETGVTSAEIIAETKDWLTYDLPPDLAARFWGGRYRGQRQKWFAMRFLGGDDDIDLNAHKPEFEAWKWLTPDELTDRIVPFKRQLYHDIFAAFETVISAEQDR